MFFRKLENVFQPNEGISQKVRRKKHQETEYLADEQN